MNIIDFSKWKRVQWSDVRQWNLYPSARCEEKLINSKIDHMLRIRKESAIVPPIGKEPRVMNLC